MLDKHTLFETENIILYDVMFISSNQESGYNRSLDTNKIIEKEYKGHHFLDWRRPRKLWLSNSKPTYFDFGGDLLWFLERFKNEYWCVKKIIKKEFIENVKNEN